MASCPSCGRELAEGASSCSACGQRVGMKRCPYCAEEIQAAAVVCRFCNRELVALPAAAAPPPMPPSPPPPAAARAAAKPPKPAWAPASPLRTKLMWIGAGMTGIAVVMAFVGWAGWMGWGFLLLWAGLALLLNRGPVVLKGFGTLIGALVLLIPLVAMRTAIDQGRAAAAEAKRKAEQLPIVEKQLNDAMAAGQWDAASAAHARLKSLQPNHPSLSPAWSKIQPEQQKLQAARAEEQRRKNVALGLSQAKSVVADKKLCDTAKAISDAWGLLKHVRREDPEWNAAAAVAPRLEVCRRSVEQAFSQGLRKIMIGQREQWAKNAETKMLDEGMNVDFVLSGAAKDQLTVKWALMSKAAVHKITDGGSMRENAFLAQMQKIGFKRVSFSNGWNFGVYYTLEPPDETSGGKTVWAGMGITGPLALR